MEHAQQAYSAFHDPEAPSLAATLRQFEELPGESVSRKARARAAVATVCRLLKKPAGEIPAQPNSLMRQFSRFRKAPTGLTAKSMANCKTELRYLLRKAGGHSGRSGFRPLSADWLAIRDAYGKQPLIWKLSRFMAFCSGSGVGPQEVDDGTLEKFRTALRASAEIDKPETKVRDTIGAWNKLSALAVDMRLPKLFVPPAQIARWTIEPNKFPQSFQDDVSGWQERLSHVDPDAEEGPIHASRPASLKLYKHQVFKAASALVFSGRPIESLTSLGCLVDIDAFKAILKHLRLRQGGKLTLALHGVGTTLTGIARHQEHRDDEHVKRMARICANYNVTDSISKSHERLKAFEDERLTGALLHLPDRLLKEAANPKASPRTARTLAQVAIALEIEMHAPLRRENLVALNTQQNIQSVTVNGQPRWIVRFEPHETKNRARLTYELPTVAVRRIESALGFYAQPNGWLFPGTKGSHKQGELLGKQVKRIVEQRLGIPFHLHMMRGLVATIQTREHDNGLEFARAMLGDRSDRTVRKYYISTAEQHLIRQAQDTIQAVRLRTAPLAPARSKRATAV